MVNYAEGVPPFYIFMGADILITKVINRPNTSYLFG